MFWKKQPKKIVMPVEPKLQGFDYFIVSISIALLLFGFMGGVQLITGMLAGLGFVIGVMIVMLKFKWIRRFVFKRSRYIDAAALFIGLILSTTSFAMLTATFAGVFLSAFLAIYGYVSAKKEYNEQLITYKQLVGMV